jgi:hypothetical protein
MKRYLILAILIFSFGSFGVFGYAQSPGETEASVPALSDFHEVIYQIWHEAWPNKNTAMLQKLLPDVEKGIAGVAAAQLPGILRDKKAAWDEGVQKLKAVGAEYKAAVEAKDDAKLMSAAELLHSRFEQLMRTIRPPLAELEAFHTVLYMLYHHYLPKSEMENIRKAAAEMTQKMSALNNAKLPERRKDKEPEFQSKRAQLSESVVALESVVKSGDQKAIKDAAEKVHSNYQALEHIF